MAFQELTQALPENQQFKESHHVSQNQKTNQPKPNFKFLKKISHTLIHNQMFLLMMLSI